MKVVNDFQERKLQTIQEGLKKIRAIRDEADSDKGLCELIKKYADEETGSLPRRLKQFESNIVIIVALGMLKAGKSTLINLLARTRCASPMGYGVDTTLRPALVKMADKSAYGDKGQITVYYSANGDDDAALAELMDHLRGLKKRQNVLRSTTAALTEENLNNALCREAGIGRGNLLEQEPLLVVVEVPYNENCKILDDGRMLLDMPGLDSANAAISLARAPRKGDEELFGEKEEDSNIANLITRYEAVIRECDLMLFVQSSVAPLNEKACDMLHRILAIRDSASAYIVQNIMQARYWRTEKSQDEDRETQERHATKVFTEKFRRSSQGFTQGTRSTSVNLGMAYDGLFPENPEYSPIATSRALADGAPISQATLLERSEFPKLEGNLLSLLQTSSTSSRYSYCINQLLTELIMAIEEFRSQVDTIKEKYKQEEKKWNYWVAENKAAADILYHGAHIRRPGHVTVKKLPSFGVNINAAKSRVPAMRECKKPTIFKVNDYLDALKEECYREGASFITHATLGNIGISSADGELPGALHCNDLIKEVFEKLKGEYQLEEVDNKPLVLERPHCTVSDAETYLKFDAPPPDGVQKQEAALENIEKLDTGGFWRSFPPFRKRISVGDPLLKGYDEEGNGGKEKEYKDAFNKMIVNFINAHICEAIRNIVDEALKESSQVYMEKLKSLQEEQRKLCDALDTARRRGQQIVGELEKFKETVESMRI